MMIGYDFTIVLQWSIFHCVKTWFWRPVFFACDSTVGLKKNGTRQKKLTQFFWFFNSVKPSFERYVRIMVKIQWHLKKLFDRYCQVDN
jgi:hypothetical protein